VLGLVGIATTAALLLTGCSSSAGKSDLKSAAATLGKTDLNPVDVSQLQQGGTFTWPVDQLPDNWNYNQYDGTLADGWAQLSSMMPRIFLANASVKLNPNPDYVTSAKLVSQSPEIVEYQINPKAKWSNGRQFSWEDFYYQWKALNGTNTAFNVSSTTGYQDIGNVEKGASDLDVKVTFSTAFSEWQSLFTPLYPKETNSDPAVFNKGWIDKPQITAGPFKVSSIDTTAKQDILVPDSNWWGQKPVLDKLVFKVISRASQADSLANSAIDFYRIGSSRDMYGRAKQTSVARIAQSVEPSSNVLQLNGKATSPLGDLATRLAVVKGIDTQAISDAMTKGMVPDPQPLVNHFFSIGTPQYKDNRGSQKYDKAEAAKELDAAGWKLDGQYRKKNGKELDLTYILDSGNAITTNIANLIVGQLGAVGVKVTINSVDPTKLFSDYVTVGNFDLVGMGWTASSTPITGNSSIYSLDLQNPNNSQQNYSKIGSQEINDLFAQAGKEFDDAKRIALANQIDAAIWKIGNTLPLYQVPGTYAVNKKVANFGAFGFADIDYTKIGFTK
jgi:peptide/nickel transport system substrate-binding protein